MLKLRSLYHNFRDPLFVLLGMILYGVLFLMGQHLIATIVILIAIGIGSYSLVIETFQSLLKKQFALDYIAILAVVVSVITGEYFVASIIALMISSGATLEAYGANQAKKSLTNLIDRIPQNVTLWTKNAPGSTLAISKIDVGQEIFIRKGEVIPLDGTLLSQKGLTDESSLTGEPYAVEKEEGDMIRSGTINVGEPMIIRVTKAEKDSTYRKIITMVQAAQTEKAPLIRLADRYSTIFTLITAVIATFAFFNLGGLKGALAVLVIATPCPLIIATPIALLGGVNAAAKKRIIIKKLAILETLQRVNTLVFDKTGTITLGQPQVTSLSVIDKNYSQKEILSIASAIERHSLHPLAKAVVSKAQEEKAPHMVATGVTEEIGKGISGNVNEKYYTLRKLAEEKAEGMQIELVSDSKQLAVFSFEDILKSDSKPMMAALQSHGYHLSIFTGDKKAAAENIASQLGTTIAVRAEMKPEDKQQGIAAFKEEGKVVAMIGDGINDAPALALADVGMVFSHEEQTASSEAADVVLLGGNFQQATEALSISKKTVRIALQSILFGIGLSIVGMILASFGLIPPLLGAGIQEAIDIAVILNALRASRI